MRKTDKKELKERMYNKISEVVDAMDVIGKIDYFEVTFKHVNGDINMKMGFTDIEKKRVDG